jgi:hypothetical protein
MADQSRDELACVYAALVLLDDDVAITVNIIFKLLTFLLPENLVVGGNSFIVSRINWSVLNVIFS